MKSFLLVGLGGALGAMCRYGITLLFNLLNINRLAAADAASYAALLKGSAGTFATNSLGCLLMGLFVSLCPAGSWQLMLTVGLCGGFTTYSTFSMQSVTMLQQGRYGLAAIYILGTVLCCITFAALGCWIGGKLR